MKQIHISNDIICRNKKDCCTAVIKFMQNALKKINIVSNAWWWKWILFSFSNFLVRKMTLALIYF
jgi:hypothetical protein